MGVRLLTVLFDFNRDGYTLVDRFKRGQIQLDKTSSGSDILSAIS